MADYIGSTSGIIDFATASGEQEFIICTETGVLYELRQKNPGKRFYLAGNQQLCPNMKRITLDKVAAALEQMTNTVELEEEVRVRANQPLERMLELGS